MSRLKTPHDVSSAKEVMKVFSDMAYSLAHKTIFQQAVELLYGREFEIKVDLSKRMQFSCLICNCDMNSEKAVQDHFRSGNHQKNRDKKSRESGETCYQVRASNYPKDSLRYNLLCSTNKPLGLQMVEEYVYNGKTYHKCNLCCAHGKTDPMYLHLTGKKHTEAYIKSAFTLESHTLTANERVELQKELVRMEGVNCDAIKTIKGREYFPLKWEAEGKPQKSGHYMSKLKLEDRPIKREPGYGTPGPSKSRRHRRRSSDSSGSSSPSPERNSRKRSPSPPPARKKYESSSFKEEMRFKRAMRSPSLSRFRNKSPPREFLADLNAALRKEVPPPPPSLEIFQPPLPPSPVPPPTRPVPPPTKAIPPPTQLVPASVETKEKQVQKMDIEELMTQLTFIVHTLDRPDSQVENQDDVKVCVDLMFKISKALYDITRIHLDGPIPKSTERKQMLETQKLMLAKILGHVTKRFDAAFKKENRKKN